MMVANDLDFRSPRTLLEQSTAETYIKKIPSNIKLTKKWWLQLSIISYSLLQLLIACILRRHTHKFTTDKVVDVSSILK